VAGIKRVNVTVGLSSDLGGMTTVTKEAAVVETPTTCGLLLSTFNTKLPLAGGAEGVSVRVSMEPTVVPESNVTFSGVTLTVSTGNGGGGGGGKGVKGTGISALMVGTGAGEGIGGMVGAGRGGWIAMVGVGKGIPGAIGGKPTSVPPVGTLGVCGGMIGPGTKLVALLSLDC
jgi:hypothetical protein